MVVYMEPLGEGVGFRFWALKESCVKGCTRFSALKLEFVFFDVLQNTTKGCFNCCLYCGS